jgi:hypothetical protein
MDPERVRTLVEGALKPFRGRAIVASDLEGRGDADMVVEVHRVERA